MSYCGEKGRKKQLIPTLNQKFQCRTKVTACDASTFKTKTPSDSGDTGKNEKDKNNDQTLQHKLGGPNGHKISLDFFEFTIR